MIMSERNKKREERKLEILAEFSEGKKLYTNQVAKTIGVVWPVADRLLQELVDEGRLSGNKRTGYVVFKKPTVWERIKQVFHV